MILLTNYSMLEYLLLCHKNIELFLEAPLKFIVLNEFILIQVHEDRKLLALSTNAGYN